MQILVPPQSSWFRPPRTSIAGLSLCGMTVAAQTFRGGLERRRRRTAALHMISKAVRPTMQLVHTNTSVTTAQLKRTRRLRRAVLNMQPKVGSAIEVTWANCHLSNRATPPGRQFMTSSMHLDQALVTTDCKST